MMSGRTTSPEHDLLSANIRALGDALGRIITTQQGPDALALVEQVRRMAKELRNAPHETDPQALPRLIADLSLPQLQNLVKAFTLYFGLVNLAEGVERLRALRVRDLRNAPAPAPRASPTRSRCSNATACRQTLSKHGLTTP